MMSKTFLKTNEGRNIIMLDYFGYHLTNSLSDLTVPQYMFILLGRLELHEEMNKID